MSNQSFSVLKLTYVNKWTHGQTFSTSDHAACLSVVLNLSINFISDVYPKIIYRRNKKSHNWVNFWHTTDVKKILELLNESIYQLRSFGLELYLYVVKLSTFTFEKRTLNEWTKKSFIVHFCKMTVQIFHIYMRMYVQNTNLTFILF